MIPITSNLFAFILTQREKIRIEGFNLKRKERIKPRGLFLFLLSGSGGLVSEALFFVDGGHF